MITISVKGKQKTGLDFLLCAANERNHRGTSLQAGWPENT
jgi:hypothetical protein